MTMICSKCHSNNIDIPASLICSTCKIEVENIHADYMRKQNESADLELDVCRRKVWRNTICIEEHGLSNRFKDISLHDIKNYNYDNFVKLISAAKDSNIIILDGENLTGKSYLAIKFLYSNYTTFDSSLYYVSLIDIIENNFNSETFLNARFVILDDIKAELLDKVGDAAVYYIYKRLMTSPQNTFLVSTSLAFRDFLMRVADKHSDVVTLKYYLLKCDTQYSKEEFDIKTI